MIIVTCRIYPKYMGLPNKEASYIFDNPHQLKVFFIRHQNEIIVDKVFEIKEENNG